ncbi:MAG: hypothetical protein AAF990_26375 [Bacteroidota bacterium]
MKIVEVKTKSQLRTFIDFPHDLYASDPNYVPELYLSQKELLSSSKNPFFQHSKLSLFLALDAKGTILGRIAAIRNNKYIEFSERAAGFFGFFDVVENYEVAELLFQRAEHWIKEEGLEYIIGPANPTSNDTMGILVKGYDRPPIFQMTYNKPYYVDFLARYGFEKGMDILAYWVTKETINRKALRIADAFEKRLNNKGITFRTVKLKNFKEEAKAIKSVYQKAWDKNWGFVPPTDEEFDFLADGLKLVVDQDLVILAEKEGQPIGFALALPDINQVAINMRKGRLLPFGIFKLLLGKKKINVLRIILLGVVEEYRKMGIEAIFYAHIISNGLKKNYVAAEASWILENNKMMNQGLINLNAEAYKRYRIFEKKVDIVQAKQVTATV